MKLVFMGTPDFAVPSLKALAAEHEILCVVSQPDRPKGRGYQLIPTPVKEAANALGLPVLQPDKIKTPEFLTTMRELSPDFIVVVAYGKILPQDLLDIPPYGSINLHGSLLPKYRGAAPIEWSIINGEKEVGITTMYMAAGIDSGDMIYQHAIPLDDNITGGELRETLSTIGASLLSRTIVDIAKGIAPRVPQNHTEACLAPMLTKEMGKLDFSQPAVRLHNLIRGLNTMISAYASCGGKKVKILKTAVCTNAQGAPGKIVFTDGKLYVCCGEGSLELLTLIPEGKAAMSGAAFNNGYRPVIFE